MQENRIKLWCNDFESSMFKAFMSALLIDNTNYDKVDQAEDADLWCLVNDYNPRLVELYQAIANPPKVIYLARNFHTPPISKWVFFKSPVNVSALLNWIHAQDFSPAEQKNENTSATTLLPEDNALEQSRAATDVTTTTDATTNRWHNEAFKLQYWPNVTQYSDSPDIMIVCTTLLRDWTKFKDIPQTQLDPTIIEQLLIDAEAENNLIYQPVTSASDSSNNDDKAGMADSLSGHHGTTDESKDAGWGFFKSLFNRFRN